MQDGEAYRAVTEKNAVRRFFALGLCAAYFHEVERLLVEFRGGIRVLGGYRDVSKLRHRSVEHTSELQTRFGISYAAFCLKKQLTSRPVPRPHRAIATPPSPHATGAR